MRGPKTSLVWRKSIYDNDFICHCGARLYKDGKPTNKIIVGEDNRMYCGICGLYVAQIGPNVPGYIRGGNVDEKIQELKELAERINEEREADAKQLRLRDIFIDKLKKENLDQDALIQTLRKEKDACEKRLSAQIRRLTKEINALEHRMKEMEEAHMGGD